MRHSLRGLCGLKYRPPLQGAFGPPSQPARAVWIEISGGPGRSRRLSSQPARAVWIEIT